MTRFELPSEVSTQPGPTAEHGTRRARRVLTLITAGMLTLAACGRRGSPAASARERPNVLVFLVDTLRADRLSCYGHDAPTSPNLDAFARGALRFENVYAPAPVTVASHATLFSSVPPAVHGAWNRADEEGAAGEHPALSPHAITLAEVLAASGWQTAAFCVGGFLRKGRGLDQGFQVFESSFEGVENRVDRALTWLRGRGDGAPPFFLFLHTYEVHTPWLPEEELLALFDDGYQGRLRERLEQARAFAAEGTSTSPIVDTHRRFFQPLLEELDESEIEFVKAMYDAEIRKVDREFARLLGELEGLDLLDETILVITSDHGEEFGEHGRWGHQQLYEECLRVPLIVRLPGQREGRVRQDPVELTDLMPTLLGELGLRIPHMAMGRVIDLHAPEPQDEAREIWAEINLPRPQVALRRGPSKVLFHPAQQWRAHSFDLGRDPLELSQAVSDPAGAGGVEQALRLLGEWRRRCGAWAREHDLSAVPAAGRTFQASQVEELRALGYL